MEFDKEETGINDFLIGNRFINKIAYPIPENDKHSNKRSTPGKRIQPVHDCRPAVVQSTDDAKDWEAYLFSHGVRKTCNAVRDLTAPAEQQGDKMIHTEQNKLLFTAGSRGSGNGEFRYPRALAITADGDIYVADSMNHRLQVFTQAGLFRFSFGKKGSGSGEFEQPMGIAILPTDDVIVVADSGNRRIQMFSLKGVFKISFPTADEPYFINCDDSGYILSSTMKRNIEIYNRSGKMLRNFDIDNCEQTVVLIPTKIALSREEYIIAADIATGTIKCLDYNGVLLHQFTPSASKAGLFCEPMAVFVNQHDQIILSDSLNRTINLYNQRGDFLKELLKVSESSGIGQECAVSPEGHLVVLQFAANGEHCLKAFRYMPCQCHKPKTRSATGSSRMDYL